MLKPALVFFLFVALAHGHMTGVCLSRISDGRLQVAVEHWHGGTAVRAGASFAIRQGGLVASGPWQAPLACDCPDRNGCATSYHDCGCSGNGIWFAIVADPGFVPGNVQVQGINGGSVTAGCGSCTEVSGVTTATMPLPPPASTCFADICGDGIISGPEVCEIGGTCAPGYPPTTCGTCCVTGTPCCQTGNAVCRNTVVNLDNSGQATVTFGAIDNGSTLSADCPQPGYPQVTPSTVNCGHFPSTSVSLLVGPAGAAHGETCTATVTVNDPIPPQISCPSSIVRGTDTNQCHAAVSYSTPVGTDQCPGASTTRTAGQASGTNFGVGTTTNTFVVTDQASLTASCSFTVTVSDDQGPSISCPSSMTVAATGPSCTAPVTFTAPVGTDNCPGASTSQTAGLPSGSTFPLGPTTQTFQVTDATGRTASCSFTVTVTDGQNPSITCPSSISVNSDAGNCGAVVTYTAPVGTDNCSGPTTALIAGLGSGSTFPIGSTTETYQVTDVGGRTASCSFTVTVTDNENPTIDGSNGSTPCPAPMTVNTDNNVCTAGVTYTTPVGTDNCPGATTAQAGGIASGGTFPLGLTTNSFTVTDASSNTATCGFVVSVQDNQDPNIDGSQGSTACPSSFTVNSDAGLCGATVTYTNPVGTDACPGANTALTAGQASGSFFNIGATTQTFTVTDAAGNTASCSFTVTVVDAEAPTIDGSNGSSPCPSTITTNADPNSCQTSVSYATPFGTDQCPGASTAQTAGLASGSLFTVGTTANTFVVTDAASLTDTCTFNVVVQDSQPPQIDGTFGSTPCPAPITVNNDPGRCEAIVFYTVPVGTDACPGATTALTTGLGTGQRFPAPGPTTETYVVTDAAGQTASCSFTVTVNDIDDPVMDGSNGSTPCPPFMNVNTDPGVCTAAVTYTDPVGVDQCGSTTTQTGGLASGSNFPLGSTTNAFTAADNAGNSVSCSFTVTVTDNENPVIDGTLGSVGCPANMAVNNDPGACGAFVTYTTPVGADGCAGATTALTAGVGSGGFFPVGTTTETYEVTDAGGRTASCSFTVTVVDVEPPTLNGSDGTSPCMAPVVVGNDAGLCSAVVNYAVPTVSDNCGSLTPSLTSGLGTGAAFPQFTSTETYTVSDAGGNSVTCSFDITVEDREAPVISHTPTGVVQAFPGQPYNYVVTMTDNCATSTYSHVSGPQPHHFSDVPTEPTLVEFEGVDVAGNRVQYNFHVQTIFVATGVPIPAYMYVPMTLDIAPAAFPSDTHVTYQLRPIGGGAAAFESVRANLKDRVEFEGASQVLPGRWEFWMVGWPSATARFGEEFILCASEHFCY